jgi:hypothetical protein
VHGFDLSIVEEFPHPLPRSKVPDAPNCVLVVAEQTIDPAASQCAREEACQMIAAMLKTFKPRMGPPEFCHPGCRRAWGSGTFALCGNDRKIRSTD